MENKTENVRLITIETAQSQMTVKQLKAEINELRDALLNLDENTQEYQDTAAKLQSDQAKLNEVMSVSKTGTEGLRTEIKTLRDSLVTLDEGSQEYNDTVKQLQDAQDKLNSVMAAGKKSGDAAEGSYDHLVATMAKLKKEWRATTDVAKRDDLGKQIKAINDELKELDESTGNFQRNVGDYKNQMVAAFTATAGAAGAVINPIKGATLGLQALSKTPVIAILGLLVNILSKVISSLKSSEDNINGMSSAMGVFNAVGDLTTKIFQALGKAIAKASEWISGLLSRFTKLNEKLTERQEIQKAELELIRQTRKVNEDNADAELKIAQLRQKAVDKATYSAQQRLVYLRQALDEEEAISKRDLELATQEYELLKRKSELAGNSVEENDELSQAYVRMKNAETSYYNKSRELITQMNEARNQAAAEEKARLAERGAGMEELTATEEKMNAITQESMTRMMNARIETINMEIDAENAKNAELERLRQEDEAREKQHIANRKAMLSALATNTANILNSVADIMEANGKQSEQEEKRIKNLRIAAAMVNTISGAVGAFSQASATIPPPAGQIVGAAAAASVMASGLAQISQMKAINVAANDTAPRLSSSGVSVTPPAYTLPTTSQGVSATGQDAIAAINQQGAAAEAATTNEPLQVFILSSQLEANAAQVAVQQRETSF